MNWSCGILGLWYKWRQCGHFKKLGKCHDSYLSAECEPAHRGKLDQVVDSSIVVACCSKLVGRSRAVLFLGVGVCSSLMRTLNWLTSNLRTAMGVPNSREYSYYHAPNTPFRILLKSKYRFLCGMKEMLSCFLFSHLQCYCVKVLCNTQCTL